MKKQSVQEDGTSKDFRPASKHAETTRILAISNGSRPGVESKAGTKRSGDELVRAIEEMKSLRKRIGRLTLEEILSARDEGRK